ncbi:MAG: class I SAM-dependent rRNA methyltransferase [Polyangiales bacterium]
MNLRDDGSKEIGSPVTQETTLRLRVPLERMLHAGHPWVYTRALHSPPTVAGAVVAVQGRNGRLIGRGISDLGPIAVRMFSIGDEPLDARLFAERLSAACELRQRILPADTNTYRLVHGEGDRLPGFVVDIYAAYAVLRFDSQALHSWLPVWLEVLRPQLQRIGVRGAVARVPKDEDFGVQHVWGEPPPELVTVVERGMKLIASLWHGQKTGLFLDHRESRWRIRQLSDRCRVLNLYGYTGGFSVAAGLGGAKEVVTVDSARPALELATQSWNINSLQPHRHRVVASDVARFMHALGSDERFDLVIADPPSFAPSKRTIPAAIRAYGSLHRSCLQHVEDGGLYLAASCSSHISVDVFEASLHDAARAANRSAQIVESWGAAPDHPVLSAFPEGNYLKVRLLRITE